VCFEHLPKPDTSDLTSKLRERCLTCLAPLILLDGLHEGVDTVVCGPVNEDGDELVIGEGDMLTLGASLGGFGVDVLVGLVGLGDG
jgi:hypothetical protein